MDAIRKRIIQNVETALTSIDALRSVGFGSFEPSRLEKPCAGIMPIEEPAEVVTTDGALDMSLKFIVRVVVEESFQKAGYELEDILPAIEGAVMADPTRGGLALNTQLETTRWLFLDREWPQAGADIQLLVMYHRDRKNPAV
jgi:hypothetical protein